MKGEKGRVCPVAFAQVLLYCVRAKWVHFYGKLLVRFQRASKRFRIIAHAMLETREKKRQVNCMPNIYCIFLEVLALGRSMDIYHQTLHRPS